MLNFERRRQALIALKDSLDVRGPVAFIANKIEKDSSYVSRLMLPLDHPNRKRITEATVQQLNHAFPGWLDQTDAQPLPSLKDALERVKLHLNGLEQNQRDEFKQILMIYLDTGRETTKLDLLSINSKANFCQAA